jgi:RNA polymerase sigma-70 factor (family 1)
MAAIQYLDEKVLLNRLKAGDRDAFAKLYDRYSDRIYGKLLKLTQADFLADELLQDTFVKLWEKRHLIDSELSIKAWLYKVAENEVYMFYRKLARDKRLQEQLVSVFTEAYSHTEEDIYLKESRALLEKAIEQLSPQRREVFKLCKVEGRSYDETAQLLNISTSTVSNHLVKATQSVRAYIFQSRETVAILMTAYLLGR